MNKLNLIILTFVVCISATVQARAQSTDELAPSQQEILIQQPELPLEQSKQADVSSKHEILVQISDSLEPIPYHEEIVSTWLIEEILTGSNSWLITTLSDTGIVVVTWDVISSGVIIPILSEEQKSFVLRLNDNLIFANPKTWSEVINWKLVKKTKILDLSPQAQDFVNQIMWN